MVSIFKFTSLFFLFVFAGVFAEKYSRVQTNILPNIQQVKYVKLPDWPKDMILEGPASQWQSIVFRGKDLVGVMWKSSKGKLLINGYPYDQMVHITKGSLILHPKGKSSTTYMAGDVFILPKGFEGVWEMPEEYEEFIVVEKEIFFQYE